MAKQAKATKKFEKKHLRGTLDRRKEFAKVKQRHQLKAKKKQRAERRAQQEQEQEGAHNEREEVVGSGPENMNEDAYFQNGVSVPELPTTKTKKVKQHIGKRKRGEEAPDEAVESSSSGESDQNDTEDEEMGLNQDQLDALAEKDPEFYKYLKENDAELLDFDEDADLAEIDELSASDEPGQPTKKRKHSSQSLAASETVVTDAMINRWKASLSEQYSIRTLRQLVLAFRAAAHVNDEDEDEFKYSIPDSETYHELLMTALREVPTVLNHHLPVKETSAGKLRVPTESSKFKTLAPLIKSHASSLHHLLSHLSDAGTLKLALQSFEPLLPYLLQFRKFLKVIIKTVSAIWSDNSSDDPTRISAFLILRRLMVTGDAGIRETVLRATYEGIVRSSRNTTIHTLPGINLMKNSAAELWGLDQKVAYTTGFKDIRQLAVTLRGTVIKPTKDSYKTIYNWQFVHALDFWSRVLSMHCNSLREVENGKESQLRPLIYPVVQITLGVMRLIPTPTYFPLRFHLMRSLLRISQSTGSYIPLASSLFEVLNSVEIKKPSKASTLRPLDFESNIRAPGSYLKTRVYQDGVGEQVIELFTEFFALWCKSVAFPELQIPVVVMLKRWLRSASAKATGNKNAKLNQGLLLVVQKSEANARWIEERRNKVSFAPHNRTEVESFLRDESWETTPFGAFAVSQRKIREERKKVLEQGRREEESRRKKSRKEKDTDDFDVDIEA